MKLGKIEHERCGDYDDITFVWVPEDWTEQQFQDAVRSAKRDYIEFCEKYREEGQNAPNNATPYSKPDYAAHPTLTVAEVDEIHAKEKEVYAAWNEVRQQAKRPFSVYLAAHGLVEFYKHEPAMETTVHWGHRHGWPLDYAQDSPTSKDKQGPGYEEDIW